jgi:LmeA-like phospholipid-binding
MEWIVIILSGLLAAISPTGLIIDRVAEKNLRDRVEEVEQLEVRIDNAPSYQVLQGKVDRVRIAGRGVKPIPDLRIAVVELETDPINVDLQRLRQQGGSVFLQALRQPASAAARLVITEKDLNQTLQSPKIRSRLEGIINNLVKRNSGSTASTFKILNTRLDFLANNRFGFQIQLQPAKLQANAAKPIEIYLEVGLNVVSGRSLQIREPQGTLNGRRLSTRILRGFAEGANEQLDLRRFEKRGITARLLQFKIAEEEMKIAAFFRIEPKTAIDRQ